ncbi:protein SYG1 [Physcia stellaris]|nr:protein SYG1 [Physcia stellaris]
MKFAKALEQDLTGKKKVKAVARALKNVNQTPKTPGRQKPSNLFSSASYQSTHNRRASAQGLFSQTSSGQDGSETPSPASAEGPPPDGYSSPLKSGNHDIENRKPTAESGTSPMAIKRRSSTHEDNDESATLWDSGAVTNYGSIISSPPNSRLLRQPPSLELPDPAMSPNEEAFPRHNRAWRHSRLNPNITPPARQPEGAAGDAFHIGKTHTPTKTQHSALLPRHRQIFAKRRSVSTPGGPISPAKPPLLRRLFSNAPIGSPTVGDVPLEAYKEVDLRQADFLTFLDKQLEKIEAFYKMKETEAVERLTLLKQQLHELRDRRLAEVEAAQRAQEHVRRERERLGSKYTENMNGDVDRTGSTSTISKWIQPIGNAMGLGDHFGKNTKALGQMQTSPGPCPQHLHSHVQSDMQRDFSRRPINYDDVPYRSAKRKLKLAMQEFYRGLELLKSFALLNRTAFRKINKKYDKACQARPTGRYMSEKVNKAWFVQSEVLEAHIVAVEDLYARYFERGNHKVAVGKLRSKTSKTGDYTGSVFRNGLLLAGGLVFGIEGIVYGGKHLANPDPRVRMEASYLLQIYGGYFLGLFLFLLFCVDCWIWSLAKINYVFIFEFDTRHNLDWRQLSELPSLLFFLLGLSLWLNFQQTGANTMYIYWPVLLIILTIIILLFPGPLLYHRSRQWWAYSNFRLLLAGIYPVEFRDFFLGDMYCSQTYTMGNVELFFCLYAHHWSQPTQCNSTHSRLLGFFSCLPGIWRALQCLRRYYDTRNAFPHLVNCGKYTFTILTYMTLSLYRIDENHSLRALFIVCATINAIYCSIWDLAMDWSLGNPYAEHRFLRDVLGFKHPWMYYASMILDPILRFNWIFYAIFTNELQHSALLSFFIAFSEICRRGIWTLFRVENEHCTNVGRFRASRDVPLPYDLPSPEEERLQDVPEEGQEQVRPTQMRSDSGRPRTATGADLESVLSQPSPGALRRRQTMETGTPIQRGIARVGTIMNEAHVQDFERKRRPGVGESGSLKYEKDPAAEHSSDESDEEGEETSGSGGETSRQNQEDLLDTGSILERRPSAVG